jgi:hypothetical protein
VGPEGVTPSQWSSHPNSSRLLCVQHVCEDLSVQMCVSQSEEHHDFDGLAVELLFATERNRNQRIGDLEGILKVSYFCRIDAQSRRRRKLQGIFFHTWNTSHAAKLVNGRMRIDQNCGGYCLSTRKALECYFYYHSPFWLASTLKPEELF